MTNHTPSYSPTPEGVEATKRWFGDDASIDAIVDSIVDRVEELKAAEPKPEPTLFGDDPDPVNCASRRPRNRRDIRGLVSQAFLSMFDGIPEDHVVINPCANVEFISRCRLLGADASDFELNRTLLNVRKAGWHADVTRNYVPPLARETINRIGYAAEMAARLVQIEAKDAGGDPPSVDRMLCDPEFRDSFDSIVNSLVPGYSTYEFRLAAFAFRKAGRVSKLANVDLPEWQFRAPLRTVDLDDVPEGPGLYAVMTGRSSMFVSSTLDLRERVRAHLAVADGVSLAPPEFWEPPRKSPELLCFGSPRDWKPRRMDAVAYKVKVERRGRLNLYANVG